MPGTKSDARLNFRLAGELKKTIEEAAAQMGQTVSDFAVSTLVQTARRILHDQQVTRLSERDRQLFVANARRSIDQAEPDSGEGRQTVQEAGRLMAAWIIGRLGRTHDRSAFDCGQLMLNDWLKNRASQFDRRDLSRTFVATRPGDSHVLGYYAISTHRVLYEVLPPQESKGLPRLDVPVVLLGRLAVDQIRAKARAWIAAFGGCLAAIACRFPSTSAFGRWRSMRWMTTARQFYLKFGFRPLLDDPQHLLMPMHEIRKLNLDPLP